MDYRVYRADIRFWMIVILLSCAVGGSAGYLFFDAWWGCLLIPICIPVVQKRLRQGCLQKRTRQLKTEFREVMTLVSGSISAGYSLENAFVQTYRTSAGEFPLMEAELQILTNGIACHKRIEQLLMALADRSGVDEIRELAAIYWQLHPKESRSLPLDNRHDRSNPRCRILVPFASRPVSRKRTS